MLPTLAEIFSRYPDTDKGGSGPNVLHSYDEVYERLLEPKRSSVISVLEVGVRNGGSLKAWRDYFPKAKIYGIDNGSENGIWISDDPLRIEVFEADTIKPQTVAAVLNRFSRGYFDVIVDDGLHRSFAQATTYGTLRPYLAEGGIYVIEDLEHYEEALKLAAVLGGTLEDRRHVKGRHDDILIYFTN